MRYARQEAGGTVAGWRITLRFLRSDVDAVCEARQSVVGSGAARTIPRGDTRGVRWALASCYITMIFNRLEAWVGYTSDNLLY